MVSDGLSQENGFRELVTRKMVSAGSSHEKWFQSPCHMKNGFRGLFTRKMVSKGKMFQRTPWKVVFEGLLLAKWF